MKLSDFDYELPERLIAQEPSSRRDDSRLLVVDRATGAKEIIEAAGYPYFYAIGLSDLGLEP